MPFADRKKGKPVSEHEKSQEYEMCAACGILIPYGSKCPECGVDFKTYERRFEKYRVSE